MVGNPIAAGVNKNSVVITEPQDKEMNTYIQKLYRDKFPELREMSNLEELDFSTTIKREGVHQVSNSRIIKLVLENTEEGLWCKLSALKTHLSESTAK